MRRISEQDINRIVKKIIKEGQQSEIWIKGKSVKINPKNDSQIIVDNKYTFNVRAKKGDNDWETAHMTEITGWDEAATIKTKQNTINLNKSEIDEIFSRLIIGESYQFKYISTLIYDVYISFKRV